jgi:hypothetical protein
VYLVIEFWQQFGHWNGGHQEAVYRRTWRTGGIGGVLFAWAHGGLVRQVHVRLACCGHACSSTHWVGLSLRHCAPTSLCGPAPEALGAAGMQNQACCGTIGPVCLVRRPPHIYSAPWITRSPVRDKFGLGNGGDRVIRLAITRSSGAAPVATGFWGEASRGADTHISHTTRLTRLASLQLSTKERCHVRLALVPQKHFCQLPLQTLQHISLLRSKLVGM